MFGLILSRRELEGDPATLPELEVLQRCVVAAKPPVTLPQQTSSVERHAEQVRAMVELGAGPRAIYDRLRLEDAEFTGSLSAIKRLVLRFVRERGVSAEDVAIPVETAPGHVAQVDFGFVGSLYDPEQGVLRKAYVFVMVLGFSRRMVTRIVFDQKVETWLRLHVEAFEELGGVPEVVVPDNLKAAVVQAAFGPSDSTALHRSYRELARYYGFKVDPTPVYSPEKKGKVEAGVKYVKRSFFLPRTERDASILGAQLVAWTRDIAGNRVHATTQRKPNELFDQLERAALLPLPLLRAEFVLWRRAMVHRDSHVVFDRAMYSVPWRLIGREVWVRASGASVVLFAEEARIAEHARAKPGQRSTRVEHLPDHRSDLRERSREFWEKRAAKLGDPVLRYVQAVFDADDVLDQLRQVQAIVTHLEKFPPPRAHAACERASFYGSFTYVGIKNILRKALDLKPLPNAVAPTSQTTFRFARNVRELLDSHTETPNEPH